MYHLYLTSIVENPEPCATCGRPFELKEESRFLCDLNIENDLFWREVIGEKILDMHDEPGEDWRKMLAALYGMALTAPNSPGWDRRLAERINAIISGVDGMKGGIFRVEE